MTTSTCPQCYKIISSCCCGYRTSLCTICHQPPPKCACENECSPGTILATACDDQDPNLLCEPVESEECEEEDCEEDAACKYPNFVTTTSSFNMPACDETAEIDIENACRFTPGTQLYAQGYGFLLVTHVDNDNNKLTVKNECLGDDGDCNTALEGTLIPSGTQFATGIPFCPVSTGFSSPALIPFLASDLVVPDSGDCVNVKVTNINGLVVGDTLSIASQTFRLGNIVDSTTIQLCNDGGANGGELVEKDSDGDGELNYPVIRVEGQDPCSADVTSSLKRIIGCNGTSQEVGAVGDITGQVLVWDEVLQEWSPQVLAGVDTCLIISADVTLDPGAAFDASYLFTMPSTTTLAAALASVSPDVLSVTINDLDFYVVDIVDPTHFHAIPAFEVVDPTVVPADSLLCFNECCAQCLGGTQTTNPRALVGSGNASSTWTIEGAMDWPATGGAVKSYLIGYNTAGALTITLLDSTFNDSLDPTIGRPKHTDPLVFRQKICNTSPKGCNQRCEIEFDYEFTITNLPVNVRAHYELGHHAQPSDTLADGTTPNPYTTSPPNSVYADRCFADYIDGPSTAPSLDTTIIADTSIGAGNTSDVKAFPHKAGFFKDKFTLVRNDCANSILWFYLRLEAINTGVSAGSGLFRMNIRRYIKKFEHDEIAMPENDYDLEGFA